MSRSDYKNIYEGYLDNTGYNNRNIRERYGSCGSEPMPYEMNEKPVMENYGGCGSEPMPYEMNEKQVMEAAVMNEKPVMENYATLKTIPIYDICTNAEITSKLITEQQLKVDRYSDYGDMYNTRGTIHEDPITRQICKYNDTKWWFGYYCKGNSLGIDKHLCGDKKIFGNTDQDGQTVKKYTGISDIYQCYTKLSLDENKTAKGIVYYNNQECYTIKNNPSPYKRSGSTLIMKN
jgi:hypothetical protein